MTTVDDLRFPRVGNFVLCLKLLFVLRFSLVLRISPCILNFPLSRERSQDWTNLFVHTRYFAIIVIFGNFASAPNQASKKRAHRSSDGETLFLIFYNLNRTCSFNFLFVSIKSFLQLGFCNMNVA